jgi:hypothetical protein
LKKASSRESSRGSAAASATSWRSCRSRARDGGRTDPSGWAPHSRAWSRDGDLYCGHCVDTKFGDLPTTESPAVNI